MRAGVGLWLLLLVLGGASATAVLPSVRASFSSYANAVRELPDFLGDPGTESLVCASKLTDYIDTSNKFRRLYDNGEKNLMTVNLRTLQGEWLFPINASEQPNFKSIMGGWKARYPGESWPDMRQPLKGKSFIERYRGGERAKYISFGDIHGNIHTLMRSLKSSRAVQEDWTLEPHYHIIVNGDFVNRGYYGLEVVNVLLHLKTRNPERVHIIKGNHENTSNPDGFGDQIARYVLQDFGNYITKKWADTEAHTKELQDDSLSVFLSVFQNLVNSLIKTEQRVVYRKSVIDECSGSRWSSRCYQKKMKEESKRHLKHVSEFAGSGLDESGRFGITTLPPMYGVSWPSEHKRFLGQNGKIVVSDKEWGFINSDEIAPYVEEAYPGCGTLVDGADGVSEPIGAKCFDSLLQGAYKYTFMKAGEGLGNALEAYLKDRNLSLMSPAKFARAIFGPFKKSIQRNFGISQEEVEGLSSMLRQVLSMEVIGGKVTLGQLSRALNDRLDLPYSDDHKALFAPVVRAVASSGIWAKNINEYVLPMFLSFTQYLPQALYLQVQDRHGVPSHIMFAHGGPNLFVPMKLFLTAPIPASNADISDVNKNTLRMVVPSSRSIKESITPSYRAIQDRQPTVMFPFDRQQQVSWQAMYPQRNGKVVQELGTRVVKGEYQGVSARGVDPQLFISYIDNGNRFDFDRDSLFGDAFVRTAMMLDAEVQMEVEVPHKWPEKPTFVWVDAKSHLGYVQGQGMNFGREVVRAYKGWYNLPLIIRAHQHSDDGRALMNKFKGATRLWSAEGHNLRAHGGFVFPESSSAAWKQSEAVPLSEFGSDEVILSVATSGSGLSLQDAYLVFSMQDGVTHYHCDHNDAGDKKFRAPGACWVSDDDGESRDPSVRQNRRRRRRRRDDDGVAPPLLNTY